MNNETQTMAELQVQIAENMPQVYAAGLNAGLKTTGPFEVGTGTNSAQQADCRANGKHSLAAGRFTIANREYQAVVGVANSENEYALFVVGDGFVSKGGEVQERHNAFEVTCEDGYAIKLGDSVFTERDLLKATGRGIYKFKFHDRDSVEYNYECEPGMTWRDFVDSDYNQGGDFAFSRDELLDHDGHRVVDEEWYYVGDMDEIVNGATYFCEKM